jgi:hypothetical protein
MVWVNPPNRVNYTVISRVRNVRRYASPKCSTNRDHQGRGNSSFQIPIAKKAQTHAHVLNQHCHLRLRLFENLEGGTWIFPSSDSFYSDALLARVAGDGDAATFGFAREP